MQDNRKSTSRKMRSLLFVAALATASAVSGCAHTQSASIQHPDCTAAAESQLPASVTRAVKLAIQKNNIQTDPSSYAQTMGIRQVDKNWRADAYLLFYPGYCGFAGNIVYEPTTEQARTGKVLTPSGQPNDRVVVYRDGKLFGYHKGMCVGNEPPSLETINGEFVMRLNCDRYYSKDSLMQANPKLTQAPTN